MTSRREQLDEFESVFRRAEREAFHYVNVPLRHVLLLTDGDRSEAEAIVKDVQTFLPRLEPATNVRSLTGDDYHTVNELLEQIDRERTDLIVTYRHLQEQSLIPQHSLGVYLDVLTQVTNIPVLVLPGTAAEPHPLPGRPCERVMVVADHIAGDNRLINYGVRMCSFGGTVWLCHVEDDLVFHRYLRAISRIPEIETDVAARRLNEQLLKEARDYIETCMRMLHKEQPELTYEAIVTRGHRLQQYRDLVNEHDIDLLVTNTKDEGQLAMHGMAYSLSVELTDVALLLL